MISLLLALIYLAFISLGLPDSMIGSAWPVIHTQMNIPVSYAGILTMIVTGGTIISSLMSDRLTKKFGVGLVTAASVFLTAVALFGFSISNSFYLLCIWGIPYGLGAGAIDAALNNYVALHFASRHMSWLHCFWGVGVSISPYIMAHSLMRNQGWSNGFRTVSIIQVVLATILFISLPLWKRPLTAEQMEQAALPPLKLRDALRIKGVKYVLFAFFGYCALETTAGLWATTYLVLDKGIDTITAARYASLFFLGITVGRFLSGFVADKFGDRNMIRIGLSIIIAGIVAVGFPIGPDIIPLSGLVIIGFGCAPIYPSIIHATPTNFGKENSQAIVGIQMASAYTGSTFMAPLFGVIADHISISLYPAYLIIFAVLIIIMTEVLNRKIKT